MRLAAFSAVRRTAGERRVEHALAVRNAFAGDPREGFLIEPEALLDADHAARALGQCVLGFFHSHPDRGVYFSETDLTQAWPGYAHVVLSIRQGRYAGAGAFRINSERTEASLEPMQLP